MDTAGLGAAGSAREVGQGRLPQDATVSVVAFQEPEKPIRVVTLRITPSQHSRMRAAAHLGQQSMNQMLVAAAMKAVEEAEQQDAARTRASSQVVA
ncbi:hypothetical protein COU79_01705 [Candidatus Peregrinibacteria bacterium CG10_big_fil_rev_8_21_14_0_10_54_7]|nr:MAG: hypothetical protein COU79_01705 [Candidatus Peregrinibacteria bacterium CG10_big_fil_rev_8_21_14_0_10_54_7]